MRTAGSLVGMPDTSGEGVYDLYVFAKERHSHDLSQTTTQLST